MDVPTAVRLFQCQLGDAAVMFNQHFQTQIKDIYREHFLYRGKWLTHGPQTTQKQLVTKAWNTPTEYPRWECKHVTREFHGNESNPVLTKKARGQKHLWEVLPKHQYKIFTMHLIDLRVRKQHTDVD